jgi:hypothetical protein
MTLNSSSKYFPFWLSEGYGYLNLADKSKVDLKSSLIYGYLMYLKKASIVYVKVSLINNNNKAFCILVTLILAEWQNKMVK